MPASARWTLNCMDRLDGVRFARNASRFAVNSPMSVTKVPLQSVPPETPVGDRLDSWKEIAGYLRRDERTVRRWEKDGLPVHRHLHKKKAAIYAYKPEIDAWWSNGCSRLEEKEQVLVTA